MSDDSVEPVQEQQKRLKVDSQSLITVLEPDVDVSLDIPNLLYCVGPNTSWLVYAMSNFAMIAKEKLTVAIDDNTKFKDLCVRGSYSSEYQVMRLYYEWRTRMLHNALNNDGVVVIWIPKREKFGKEKTEDEIASLMFLLGQIIGICNKSPERVVIGLDSDHPGSTYIWHACHNYGFQVKNSLEDTCKVAVKLLEEKIKGKK